jgi:ParB-like chromosome segregation protein Spo0J
VPVERLGSREIPIASLTFLARNPRRGDEGKIRESVRRLGQYRSVVVRDTGGDLVVLAGNHTVRAMRAEGHETAYCGVIRCTDDEARRVAAADNRLGELPDPQTGERYDGDALAELLSGLDGDLDGTGWTEEDLVGLLAEDDPDPTGGVPLIAALSLPPILSAPPETYMRSGLTACSAVTRPTPTT